MKINLQVGNSIKIKKSISEYSALVASRYYVLIDINQENDTFTLSSVDRNGRGSSMNIKMPDIERFEHALENNGEKIFILETFEEIPKLQEYSGCVLAQLIFKYKYRQINSRRI